MFKKLLKKVIHSVEHSQHKHSSSKRGRQGYARHSSSDKKIQYSRHSSSDRPRSREVLLRTTVMAAVIKGINIIRIDTAAIRAERLRPQPGETCR